MESLQLEVWCKYYAVQSLNLLLGEDFVCRLWNLVIKEGSDSWKVILSAELPGHTAPIMSITNHPKENWVRVLVVCECFFTRFCIGRFALAARMAPVRSGTLSPVPS